MTKYFPRLTWEGFLLGTATHINEWINHWLRRWSFSLHRDPDGEHGMGGAHLPGTLRERRRRKFWRRAPLAAGARWGTCGVRWLSILRDSWRAPEGEHLSLWELLGELLSGDSEGYGKIWTTDPGRWQWLFYWVMSMLIRVPLTYFTDAPLIVHCSKCRPVTMICWFGKLS